MISNFKIDQAATFAGLVFLSCDPKLGFQSTAQETTKDGTPKWEIQILGAFRDGFGKTNNEVVKVGIAAHHNPADGLVAFSPVQLVDFEVGVMEKTRKDQNGQEKVIGVSVWFRASKLRSLADTTPVSGKAA
jgi:hypothetical protein